MGSENFNQIQYGLEDPKGTPVAASQMFIGQMPPILTDRKPTYPKEHFGARAASFRSVMHQYQYANTLTSEHGVFQHLPFLFSSIKGGVTPVEQMNGQGDYLWDFTPSMLGANNPDAFTLRFGDDAQAYIVEYVMHERIRISGEIAQGPDASPVKIESSIFGKQIQQTTFTGGLLPRDLEPMSAKLARFYLNSTWGVSQVETATVVGTVSGSGDAEVVVTAAGMTGSPKTLDVAVLEFDTASDVAGKIRAAMNADSAITALFTVGGAGATITLTRKIQAANDSTLNIAIDNGTCTGLTQAGTSANTTAGVLGVGGTEIQDVLRTFDIEIIPGVHPKWAGKNERAFTRHAEGEFAIMGTFGIEAGSSAVDIFADQQANEFSVLRLNIPGSQIGSGENFDLTVDFGGTFEDAQPISGADRGDNLATFVLHGYADKSTSYKLMQLSCITDHNTY